MPKVYATQARQRRKPVRCWFGGKKVPLWGQEATQARQVPLWGQEATQARQVPLWGQEGATSRNEMRADYDDRPSSIIDFYCSNFLLLVGFFGRRKTPNDLVQGANQNRS
jgi:hypothetical protein